MENLTSWFNVTLNSLQVFGENLMGALPSIIGAIVIIIFGWLIAKLLSRVIKKILKVIKLDERVFKLNNEQIIEDGIIKKTAPSVIISKFVYWTVLLLFFISASDILGWNAVSSEISNLINFLPKIFIAILIFVIGFYIASIIKKAIKTSLNTMGIEYANDFFYKKSWFMNKSVGFLICCILFVACHQKASDKAFKKSPKEVALKISNELLSRPDFMQYNTGDVYAIHYAEICAAYGAVKIANQLNNQELMSALVKHYQKATPEYIPNSENHVDANVYGVLPLEFYLHTKNKKLLDEGLYYANKQWADTLPNGLSSQTRFWIDDMYMIGCLQAQAYRATGKSIYLERAALTLNAYIKELQQPNGLFFHGNNAPFYWGRGNGWVAAGIAELLADLPASNPHYKTILNAYKTMMQTLLENQAEDGMWCQVIDKPESFKETSSTAMFGFAMALGVKNKLLPEKPYTQAYIKAWNALVEYLDEDGKIREVCVGTGQSLDVEYYFNRPRVRGDLHGQAPMLWFANELIEMY